MSDTKAKVNPIAGDDEFTIVCPYCFNRASGGNGEPISHKMVEFRSETSFSNVHEIEQKLGIKELDLELMDDSNERARKTKEFETYKRFSFSRQFHYDSYSPRGKR